MHVYHLVYDVPSVSPKRIFRVLVAYKNVYGSRFQGKPTAPTVLNGAGQLVIPGGSINGNDVIVAGQTEFFEETGIDLRKDSVRKLMKCKGEAWHRELDKGAYCVYQEVENAEAVEKECNANITKKVPLDEELFLAQVYDADGATKLFGPITLDELKKGWRGDQYNKLNKDQKKLAEKKSRDKGDWYVKAVGQLQTIH